MIEPDAAARWRSEARFDRVATTLVGLIAILAAVLAILQTDYGNTSTRAQVESARLAADVSARVSANALATDSALRAQQEALVLGMEGLSRMISAAQLSDTAAFAIGTAQQAASEKLAAALSATAATSGGAPLDAYAASLVKAVAGDLQAEVARQGQLVDESNDAGSRQLRAVLGLSFLALAGVLTGLAAVAREGRAGWISLFVACTIVGAATVLTVLTVA